MIIDVDRLRGFLDCMHAEADERDKRTKQISDIVKAARDAGYDGKAVRKVFVRERMDEAERVKQDGLLEAYEGALGAKGRALKAIESGAAVGASAAANGVHRATLSRARSVAKQTSNATPHDPETGEVINPVATQLRNQIPTSTDPERLRREVERLEHADASDGEARAPQESCSLVILASDSVAPNPVVGAEPVVPTGNEGRAGERDTPQEIFAKNANISDTRGEAPANPDGLDIPIFLRSKTEQVRVG